MYKARDGWYKKSRVQDTVSILKNSVAWLVNYDADMFIVA